MESWQNPFAIKKIYELKVLWVFYSQKITKTAKLHYRVQRRKRKISDKAYGVGLLEPL